MCPSPMKPARLRRGWGAVASVAAVMLDLPAPSHRAPVAPSRTRRSAGQVGRMGSKRRCRDIFPRFTDDPRLRVIASNDNRSSRFLSSHGGFPDVLYPKAQPDWVQPLPNERWGTPCGTARASGELNTL